MSEIPRLPSRAGAGTGRADRVGRLVLAGGLAILLGSCQEPSPPGGASSMPVESAFPAPPPASCSFGSVWSTAATAVHADFDPPVVSPRAPEPVALKVKTGDPTIDAVSLALEAGPVVPLSPMGGDLYCTLLTPSQVLQGYAADDAQHNFVGFLDLSRGGTRLSRLNMFIDVADDAVPELRPQRIADDMQATARVVNLYLPASLPSNLDSAAAIRRLYQAYPDAFDFVSLVSVPSFTGNRFHVTVRNDVQGTGVAQFNNSAAYGSAGKLLGYNRYPIGSNFDLGETASIHEIGHQWINFLSLPALRPGVPHWPISSLAYGVMGFSIGGMGGQGGTFSYQLTPVGNGDYRLDSRPPATAYNDMELYLMGLAPAESVGVQVVPLTQGQTICGGCVLRGPFATVTVQDIVAAHGPRLPSYPSAPTRFAVATLVVSVERPLTPREMSFFDYFAARGEASTPLAFTSGFARGTTLPFAQATGGRGSLVTALGPRR